jgi:hypothetical protein
LRLSLSLSLFFFFFFLLLLFREKEEEEEEEEEEDGRRKGFAFGGRVWGGYTLEYNKHVRTDKTSCVILSSFCISSSSTTVPGTVLYPVPIKFIHSFIKISIYLNK